MSRISGRVWDALPTGYSPEAAEIQMSLAICAIFRNEAAYLREWVEFHRLVGFDRFYLYQNRSDDQWQPLLEPYIQAGMVEVTEWPMESPCQLPAYQDFIGRHTGEDRWVAFIDCDEFLFASSLATVSEAIAQVNPRGWGAIGVNWMCFGASGHLRQMDGLVIERFTSRPGDRFEPNRHIKSLIRMDRVESVGPDPHHFRVNGGTFSETGDEVAGPLTARVSHNLLRINHYVTKSREEFLKRIARGRSDLAARRGADEFDGYQVAEVEDGAILRFLPALRSRIGNSRG